MALKGKKTYLGLAIALVGAVLQASGVEAEAGDVDVVADGFVTIAGIIIAWIGRWRAKVDAQRKIAEAAAQANPTITAAQRIGIFPTKEPPK